jgi:hypothetical protein
MRIGQVENLIDAELSLLLYVVNVLFPLAVPKTEIGPKELLWYKHDAILVMLQKSESRLTPEGKIIFDGLMAKLKMTPRQEAENYASSSRPMFEQSNFQF